jgi:hypothetical protein
MMKVLLLVLMLGSIASCSNSFRRNELVGDYTPLDYVNTRDTIRLLDNGVFKRIVFDKNGKLALKMQGRWIFDEYAYRQLCQ